ncbi:MAG: PIN domain-containing protein [Acidimicrobiales bacterium]
MRLVVDTNVLVGDLLRTSGRDRIADERLELFIPEQQMEEARVEIPRRVSGFARRHGLSVHGAHGLTESLLRAIAANVVVIDEAIYAGYEVEARARSTRDPDDWPLVACALAIDGAVWTHDHDLFGTGVATWTSATLQGWLDRNPGGTP